MARLLGGTATYAQPETGINNQVFNENPDQPAALQRRFNYFDYAGQRPAQGRHHDRPVQDAGQHPAAPARSATSSSTARGPRPTASWSTRPPVRNSVTLQHLLPRFMWVPNSSRSSWKSLARYFNASPANFGVNRNAAPGRSCPSSRCSISAPSQRGCRRRPWSTRDTAGGQTLSVALTPLMAAPSYGHGRLDRAKTTTTTTGDTTTSASPTTPAPQLRRRRVGDRDLDATRRVDACRPRRSTVDRQHAQAILDACSSSSSGEGRDDAGCTDHDAQQSANGRDVDAGIDVAAFTTPARLPRPRRPAALDPGTGASAGAHHDHPNDARRGDHATGRTRGFDRRHDLTRGGGGREPGNPGQEAGRVEGSPGQQEERQLLQQALEIAGLTGSSEGSRAIRQPALAPLGEARAGFVLLPDARIECPRASASDPAIAARSSRLMPVQGSCPQVLLLDSGIARTAVGGVGRPSPPGEVAEGRMRVGQACPGRVRPLRRYRPRPR